MGELWGWYVHQDALRPSGPFVGSWWANAGVATCSIWNPIRKGETFKQLNVVHVLCLKLHVHRIEIGSMHTRYLFDKSFCVPGRLVHNARCVGCTVAVRSQQGRKLPEKSYKTIGGPANLAQKNYYEGQCSKSSFNVYRMNSPNDVTDLSYKLDN